MTPQSPPDADLWILAGQSNMQGRAWFDEPFAPLAHAWSFGHDYQWRPAEPPLHTPFCAVDPVHHLKLELNFPKDYLDRRRREGRAGADACEGPGYFFARFLLEHLPAGRGIALLPCAHGGTSLDMWSPDRPGEPGATFYSAMLRRLRAGGLRPKGMLWYQGESDAEPGPAETYLDRFLAFVDRLRSDLAEPELPILTVQLGRVTRWPHASSWERIREAQRLAASRRPGLWVTSAIDAELCDLIHVALEGQIALGERLARLALTEVYRAGDFGRAIELTQPEKAMLIRDAPLEFNPDQPAGVRVNFRGVTGRLVSAGRPAGFSVTLDPPLEIHRIELNNGGPGSVLLRLQHVPPDGRVWVAYGAGTNPHCNITDEVGMPLPAFASIEAVPWD